jgi:hypothetical protein
MFGCRYRDEYAPYLREEWQAQEVCVPERLKELSSGLLVQI